MRLINFANVWLTIMKVKAQQIIIRRWTLLFQFFTLYILMIWMLLLENHVESNFHQTSFDLSWRSPTLYNFLWRFLRYIQISRVLPPPRKKTGGGVVFFLPLIQQCSYYHYSLKIIYSFIITIVSLNSFEWRDVMVLTQPWEDSMKEIETSCYDKVYIYWITIKQVFILLLFCTFIQFRIRITPHLKWLTPLPPPGQRKMWYLQWFLNRLSNRFVAYNHPKMSWRILNISMGFCGEKIKGDLF